MTNPYQLVIFDWEGTISDTLGLPLHSVIAQADALGLGHVDPYEARDYVDLGLINAVKKMFPDLSNIEYEKLFHCAQQHLISRPAEVCLIPGVLEFIHELNQAKIDLAIASNKGHQSLLRALAASHLDDFFKVTRSAGQVPAKPCPQMLIEILETFGVEPASALMIGDSALDMEMAQQIQVAAIGMDFYHQQADALKEAGALAVFDNYQDLAIFLNQCGG